MNFSKPIHITLLGSTILGVLIFALLILLKAVAHLDISFLTLFLISALTVVVSFVTYTYLIGKFINNRIKFIYRLISNKQDSKEVVDAYGSEDILEKLTKDTADWARVQKRQISQLQKQAIFRKEFLGNLAHELKTPVFSIQGYVLTLLEGGLEDDRVNRDFLERALSGVDRISNLLEDLDEIAKLETDRFELKEKRIDITKVITKVFQELEKKASKKEIDLVFDKHYEPIFVVCDEKRMTQVLVNLISNSISYGVSGGETKMSMQSIAKKKLLIEVIDNGVGMAEEHVSRLFERFYRVDKSRERNIGGSGLGLSIVKHIIEAHKQTIKVKTTEGIGSTFSFTLDRA